MNIHFKGRADGSTLATVVLIDADSPTPRFYRHTLAAGVDPWEEYGEIAMHALAHIRNKAERQRPQNTAAPRKAGRLIQLHGVLT